jgi:hypothetical protein
VTKALTYGPLRSTNPIHSNIPGRI